MARPKKNILKEKTITVHCTKVDYILIKDSAQKSKLSMSDFLRCCGLELKIETKLTTQEVELFKGVVGMANNLNQIAYQLNSGEGMAEDVDEVLINVTQLINRFK